MRETNLDYLFQSLTHNKLVAFTKRNYDNHLPRHPFIGGDGLAEIEKTLGNPSVITNYTRQSDDGKNKLKCQTFYRIFKRRAINGGKYLIDYWQVCMIYNGYYRRWEIATVLLEENSLEYAMINTRIESILHDYRK